MEGSLFMPTEEMYMERMKRVPPYYEWGGASTHLFYKFIQCRSDQPRIYIEYP